jgi:hypothetical protein
MEGGLCGETFLLWQLSRLAGVQQQSTGTSLKIAFGS